MYVKLCVDLWTRIAVLDCPRQTAVIRAHVSIIYIQNRDSRGQIVSRYVKRERYWKTKEGVKQRGRQRRTEPLYQRLLKPASSLSLSFSLCAVGAF